jgi:hypothetical protein
MNRKPSSIAESVKLRRAKQKPITEVEPPKKKKARK